MVETPQEERPSEERKAGESPTPQQPPYKPAAKRRHGKTGGGNKLLIAILACVVFLIVWGISGSVPMIEYNNLIRQNESLQNEYQALRTDYDNLETAYNMSEEQYSKLNLDYEAIEIELSSIKEVYPPREFNSHRELTDWLRDNPVPDEGTQVYANDMYAQTLQIREDALKYGYIVSATCVYDEETELYTVSCETVINGHMFWWYPDEDIAYDDPYLGFISR